MDQNFETFLLYYISWHEGEMTLAELKEMVIADIGQEGLTDALGTFRSKRLEREAAGDKRTLYDAEYKKKP